MSNRILEVSVDGGETFVSVERVYFRVYDESTLTQRCGGELTGEQVMVQHEGPYGYQEFIEFL